MVGKEGQAASEQIRNVQTGVYCIWVVEGSQKKRESLKASGVLIH